MIRTALLSVCLVLAPQLQSTWAQPQVGQPQIELQAGHTTPLWALAASPDGRLVASGGVDRTIKIWSLSDARLLRTLDGTLGIEALAFSPDGRLLGAGLDSAIALFDATTGSQIRRIAACDDVYKVRMLLSDFGSGEPSAVAALAFSPTGKFLASACDGDERPKVWELATGAKVKRFAAPPRPKEPADDFGIAQASAGFSSIAFDSSGRWLAAGGADHTVRVWEFSTGKETQVLRGHSRDVRALAFTADGRFITGSDGQRSILWNVASGATVQNRDGVWSAFDSQGRWMVAGSGGNVTTSAVDGLGGDQSAGRLPPNPPAVLSTNGQWLIGSDGNTLVARNLAGGTDIRLLDVCVANRRMVASHSGSLLALQPYYSNDPTLSLKLWNLGTNDIRTLSGPSGAHAVFSRDDRVLAAAADDKKIRLWDAATATELRTFAFAESVASLSVNSTGTLLTASGYSGKARLWDVNGDRALPDYGEDDRAGGARFSPDNRWLAYTVGPAIKIVDAETGKAVRTINGRLPMTFSADSRMLAAVAADMRVKIWDVSTGREVRTLTGDFYAVSITFSPDRRWLALHDLADRVFLWDLKRGGDARRFSGHTIGFTAGGSLLWTSRADGITRFWNAESGALVASLAMIEGSNDWAIATPEGRFDGTTVGIQKLVAWRSGDRVLLPDQFMERRAPGLLARLMSQ